MPSRRTPRPCSCGAIYEALRTGMKYRDVVAMLWDLKHPEHPERWRSKSRHAVLGYWRELKLDMWDHLHGGCNDAV